MAKDPMEWIVINDGLDNKPIGAIGFLNGKAAVVASFYEPYDANRDGSVSFGEWAAAKVSPLDVTNKHITEVAMAARYNLDVLAKDASFSEMAAKIFLNFAKGLITDGIYAVYFSRGIKMGAGALAKKLTSSTVKQFVVRKGMEKAIKKAYKAGAK